MWFAKDAKILCLAAASLVVAAAVQVEPGWVGSTFGEQGLAANSSARKGRLGLGPASIAGTWKVRYTPWTASRYDDLEIDCYGRYTNWNGWTGPMFFAAAQINAKCLYGTQASSGGFEAIIPGWYDSLNKYECWWFDLPSDAAYNYHYSATSAGSSAEGHSNNGYYGMMSGTRTSTMVCPAGLKLFLYAPHWTVVDSNGFKPDGVDPISGNDWSLSASNPVITYSGTQVFDLNSQYLETATATSWTLGNHFTECAWVYWRAMSGSGGWRTLGRPSQDHTILVSSPSGELGLYKNGVPGFFGTGYIVNTNEWNFVCVVVNAVTPVSSFYVAVGGGALAHVGTVNQFAGSGFKAHRIGYSVSQAPGYVHMFAHWEVELSEPEMWKVMSETAPAITVASLSPTMLPTASPTTSAPTASPTASPTTAAPTASPTTQTIAAPPAAVAAVGDPHMSDVRGRTFDMNAVGTITLLLVPKGATADLNSTLLRVQAGTKRAGVCGSLYIQNLFMRGTWVQREGGYNISATNKKLAQPTNRHHKWRATVGPGVKLTVAHGMTDSGILYLNFHAYGLANAHMPIGGLLGDEDIEAYAWAKEKPRECLSLSAATASAAGSEGSTASASL